jgi:glutamine synthetase
MAEELAQFAEILEKAENFDAALHDLVAETFKNHQRIIFDGNGYSQEWKEEAARRGLSNMSSTAECLPAYLSEKNLDLVTRHGIFTETEFRARHAVYTESYNKIINIEGRTMVDMAVHQILPAAMRYSDDLCKAVCHKNALNIPCKAESQLVQILSENTDALYEDIQHLKDTLASVPSDKQAASFHYYRQVLPAMERMRQHADILEAHTAKSYWPYPTYSDLLFY